MSTKTKDNSDTLRKIQILQEQHEAKLKELRDDLLKDFQADLEKISESYSELIKAGTEHREIANLPSLDRFLKPFTSSGMMSGKASSTGRQRVSGADIEKAVFEAIGSGEKSHAEIKNSEPLKKLYSGREVPNMFVKLDGMTKNKKLVKSGSGKEGKYKVAK